MISQLARRVGAFPNCRKSLINCFTRALPVCGYDPFFTHSDTSLNDQTLIQHCASLLVHKACVLQVWIGDSSSADSDAGELIGSGNCLALIKSYERETGVRIRKALHFTDHWYVARAINGGGNMKVRPEKYEDTVHRLRVLRELHLEASICLPNPLHGLAHYFAHSTRFMAPHKFNHDDIRGLLRSREENIIKDRVLKERYFQFKIEKSGVVWYDVCISRFGYPSVVSRVPLEEDEYYYPGETFPIMFPDDASGTFLPKSTSYSFFPDDASAEMKGGDAKDNPHTLTLSPKMSNQKNSESAVPVFCEFCSKLFKSDGALHTHKMAKHRDLYDGQVSCKFCSKVYKSVSALNQHTKAKHSD